MLPLTYQSLIEIPTEVRIAAAILVPVILILYELLDPYADWKIRRMAREREAELRRNGFIK